MQSTNRKYLYLLVLLVGLAPLASFASGHGGKSSEGTYPGYMPLSPPVIVNLASTRKSKYLRVDLQFFIETPEDAAAVTEQMPRIRDRMISLLGGRDPDQITTAEAREQLRSDLLASLRETMTEHTGKPAISALYFTGFIIQ